MNSVRLYLAIAIGGTAGALARYVAGEWVTGYSGRAFPWGTLLINVTGSLLLGLLSGLLPRSSLSRETRAFLTIGFCGGFTTFSTFALEAAGLLTSAHLLRASLYAASTLVLGVAAALAGLHAALAWRRHVVSE